MKIIYTLLLLLSSGSVSAQPNFLPHDSATVWTGVMSVSDGGPNNDSYYWTQFGVDSTNNDTIIEGTHYVKLNMYPGNYSTYHCGFRSDTTNQTLYIIPKDSTSEYLFFDYSLDYQIGDTVFIPHYLYFNDLSFGYFKLLELDSNLIDNNYYKTYNFEALSISDSLTNLFDSSFGIKIAERMITGSSFPFFGVGYFETAYGLACYQENGVFHWNNGGTCPLLDFTTIAENEPIKMIVFPNPSIGQFTIKSETLEIRGISIYDLNGKIVYTTNSNVNQIDLSHLNKGIYILELETPNQIIQEKIIIE